MNCKVKKGVLVTREQYIPCHRNNTLHLDVCFLFANQELYKVAKYFYGLFADGGAKAEDSK